MKRLLFLLLIIFVHCNLSAQYIYQLTPDGPNHALKPSFVRLDADTIYGICHVPSPWGLQVAQVYEELGIPHISSTIFKRSEDGLTDTIYYYSPENALYGIDVKRYDENQRIVRETTSSPSYLGYHFRDNLNVEVNPENYWYSIREYDYDTKNRISGITEKDINYSGKERISYTETFDYSTIVMTEKGYIYNGYEYEMDELNRITYSKNLNAPEHFFENGEYVELDGKQYRVEDMYYTYHEGGVTSLQYQKTGYWALGWPDRWIKTERLFLENGVMQTEYMSYDNGKTWEIYEKGETRYAYVSDKDPVTYTGDDNVQNENIDNAGIKVYGVSGAIFVTVSSDAVVSIYNTTGTMLKKQRVNAGAIQIPVSVKGLYFVTVNNSSFKVSVY